MTNTVNTKDLIYKEAAQLFSKKGYERTSMREIAEKINVSKPAIYYHFPNKQTLFENLLNTAIEYSYKMLSSIVNSKKSPIEKLKDFIKMRVQFGKEHPQITRFVGDVLSGNIRQDVSFSIHDIHSKHKTLFKQILAQGKAEGYLKKDLNDSVFVFLFIGSVNMLLMSYLKGWSDEASLENIANSLVDTLITGIGNNEVNK